MRLKISHTTEYVYSEPVQHSLQRLRLTPETGPTQNVISWETKVEGAEPEVFYIDQYGNRTELVSTNGDQHVIRITANGEVETLDRSGVFGQHKSFAPLWLFRRETPLTKAGKLVRDLVKTLEPGDELARMHSLMAAIHEKVAYVPGTTTSATSAEQALEQKSGVCQDHAHIFISAARSLGLPARYVSGYLMMPEQQEQTASHAWAEVHLEGLGWVGFDPANNICPDEHYVRIASGLDYRDAGPISGMVTGISGEDMKVTIKVEEQGQSQSQSQS
ncbi:transglutaminase family protein [Rhizobium sp. L1K21]|uniref:transglutaminase family protein n=1 Tax=Rhizobium sp. L1K21 TaxID=2954933 RepID=UPI0020921DA3|nr:transglutaminase family protein [Rhizobium sp. L1K21]MCO6185371.1 transglutaminase family protein [Rhizobium sp. L1K21]